MYKFITNSKEGLQKFRAKEVNSDLDLTPKAPRQVVPLRKKLSTKILRSVERLQSMSGKSPIERSKRKLSEMKLPPSIHIRPPTPKKCQSRGTLTIPDNISNYSSDAKSALPISISSRKRV